jgi:hypothetical protein
MNRSVEVQGGPRRQRSTREGERARGASVRILLAEDNRRLADLLEQSLTEAGWEVELVRRARCLRTRAS